MPLALSIKKCVTWLRIDDSKENAKAHNSHNLVTLNHREIPFNKNLCSNLWKHNSYFILTIDTIYFV